MQTKLTNKNNKIGKIGSVIILIILFSSSILFLINVKLSFADTINGPNQVLNFIPQHSMGLQSCYAQDRDWSFYILDSSKALYYSYSLTEFKDDATSQLISNSYNFIYTSVYCINNIVYIMYLTGTDFNIYYAKGNLTTNGIDFNFIDYTYNLNDGSNPYWNKGFIMADNTNINNPNVWFSVTSTNRDTALAKCNIDMSICSIENIYEGTWNGYYYLFYSGGWIVPFTDTVPTSKIAYVFFHYIGTDAIYTINTYNGSAWSGFINFTDTSNRLTPVNEYNAGITTINNKLFFVAGKYNGFNPSEIVLYTFTYGDSSWSSPTTLANETYGNDDVTISSNSVAIFLSYNSQVGTSTHYCLSFDYGNNFDCNLSFDNNPLNELNTQPFWDYSSAIAIGSRGTSNEKLYYTRLSNLTTFIPITTTRSSTTTSTTTSSTTITTTRTTPPPTTTITSITKSVIKVTIKSTTTITSSTLTTPFASLNNVGPIIVTMANNHNAICYSFQQCMTNEAGLWWIFHSESNQLTYSTSPNGIIWTSFGNYLTTNTDLHKYSICSDGNYLMYVVIKDGTHFKYRYGIPQSDRSISWSISETSVYVSGGTIGFPTCLFNSTTDILVSFSAGTGVELWHYDGSWSKRFAHDTAGHHTTVGEFVKLTSGFGFVFGCDITASCDNIYVITSPNGISWSSPVGSNYGDNDMFGSSAIGIGNKMLIVSPTWPQTSQGLLQFTCNYPCSSINHNTIVGDYPELNSGISYSGNKVIITGCSNSNHKIRGIISTDGGASYIPNTYPPVTYASNVCNATIFPYAFSTMPTLNNGRIPMVWLNGSSSTPNILFGLFNPSGSTTTTTTTSTTSSGKICYPIPISPNQSIINSIILYWPVWLLPIIMGGIFGLIGMFIGFLLGITMGTSVGIVPPWIDVVVIIALVIIIVRRN